MMKECPHCGAKNPKNNKKCQWCGKGFDEPVEEKKPSPVQQNNNMLPKEKKGISKLIKRRIQEIKEAPVSDANMKDMKDFIDFYERFRNKDLMLVHCIGLGFFLPLPFAIIFSKLFGDVNIIYIILIFYLVIWPLFSLMIASMYSKMKYDWDDIRETILIVVVVLGFTIIFCLMKIAGVDMNRMPLFY